MSILWVNGDAPAALQRFSRSSRTPLIPLILAVAATSSIPRHRPPALKCRCARLTSSHPEPHPQLLPPISVAIVSTRRSAAEDGVRARRSFSTAPNSSFRLGRSSMRAFSPAGSEHAATADDHRSFCARATAAGRVDPASMRRCVRGDDASR